MYFITHVQSDDSFHTFFSLTIISLQSCSSFSTVTLYFIRNKTGCLFYAWSLSGDDMCCNSLFPIMNISCCCSRWCTICFVVVSHFKFLLYVPLLNSEHQPLIRSLPQTDGTWSPVIWLLQRKWQINSMFTL